jgi:hypothetical protein
MCPICRGGNEAFGIVGQYDFKERYNSANGREEIHLRRFDEGRVGASLCSMVLRRVKLR